MYNLCAKNNEMPKDWLKGVMTIIHKNRDIDNMDNYRPITLISIIYKIWASIMETRLNHVLNLLTSENQYAYENKNQLLIFYQW